MSTSVQGHIVSNETRSFEERISDLRMRDLTRQFLAKFACEARCPGNDDFTLILLEAFFASRRAKFDWQSSWFVILWSHCDFTKDFSALEAV